MLYEERNWLGKCSFLTLRIVTTLIHLESTLKGSNPHLHVKLIEEHLERSGCVRGTRAAPGARKQQVFCNRTVAPPGATDLQDNCFVLYTRSCQSRRRFKRSCCHFLKTLRKNHPQFLPKRPTVVAVTMEIPEYLSCYFLAAPQ